MDEGRKNEVFVQLHPDMTDADIRAMADEMFDELVRQRDEARSRRAEANRRAT